MSFKSAHLVLLVAFSLGQLSMGQEDAEGSKSTLDSLKNLYYSGGTDELGWLKAISVNENDPDSIAKYAGILLSRSLPDSLHLFTHNAYMQLGNAMRYRGNFNEALDYYFKSMEFAKKLDFLEGEGKLYISIADTYSEIENSVNASEYYKKGIALLREVKDSMSLAKALINAGDEYFNQGKLDTAVLLTSESARIFRILDYPLGRAYGLGNMGMVFAEQGNDQQALENINEAISIMEAEGDYYPISVYLTYMSDIYALRAKPVLALEYADRSLALASSYGLKDQMSAANLKLSELYEQIGDTARSYQYYKDHIAYRDSVKNLESIQQMADLETRYQVSQKEAEIAIVNQQKKTQRIIAILTVIVIGIFAIGLYRRNKFIQKTKKIIEKEKDRSEALLLNILPEEIAAELKQKGKAEAREYELVSIMFTDFKEFTQTAQALSAQELVSEINHCFKGFDRICEKYEIEKIKTIGDSFMAAGGLPIPSATAIKNTVMAGLEMQRFIAERKRHQEAKGKRAFEMRLGIHTGPVVAGIVGVKKFQYDLWGDTVNTASRMESHGVVGKVNISRTTYDLLRADPDFSFEKRGKVEVKGKGVMEMYFAWLKEAS